MKKHTTRTTSLLLLQAYQNGWGSPNLESFSSDLASKGVNISPNTLSSIVRNEKELAGYTNHKIEVAYGLPEGWMDMDKTSFLSITPDDLSLLQKISDLPAEKRKCLLELVEFLNS